MDAVPETVYIISMVPACQTASIRRVVTVLLAGLFLGTGPVTAQELGGPPPWPPFEKYAPQIGEALPDITIHDDLGNPVNLRELANENYKVLVLGCLT